MQYVIVYPIVQYRSFEKIVPITNGFKTYYVHKLYQRTGQMTHKNEIAINDTAGL